MSFAGTLWLQSFSSVPSINVLKYKYHFQFAETLNITISLHRLNMSSHSSRLTPITCPVHCGIVIVIMSTAKLWSTQREEETRHYDSIVWSGDVMYSSGCFLMGALSSFVGDRRDSNNGLISLWRQFVFVPFPAGSWPLSGDKLCPIWHRQLTVANEG